MKEKKEMPTKEQVMDALATHKQIYKAANALRTTAPTLKRWMAHYGIIVNRNVKEKPEVKRPIKVMTYDGFRRLSKRLISKTLSIFKKGG